MKHKIFLVILTISITYFAHAQSDDSHFECTTITMGKKATDDGSVRTSHTDDSHRTRTNAMMIPAKTHPQGTTVTLYKRSNCDTCDNMKSYRNDSIGTIPQVNKTFAYLNTAYPCINEKQLAIGESTIGGRPELQSDNGLIDCQRLCMLLMERCSTARQAILTAGDLLKKYGWIDAGECLTITDKNEVWHLEIYGTGKGNRGAVWAAQRVPDEHISVNANASTIKEIDTTNKDYFLYSDNLFSLALDSGWWKQDEPFLFCYAYAPQSRTLLAARRREWRVFDLLAPSLKLDPNMENYPFSVKPDTVVSLEKMMSVLKDYYEGTEYDMRKNLVVKGDSGKMVMSPLANPFMCVDELRLHRINGGWHALGERAIAVRFTVYATVIQCRDWLPDEIGGVVWLGWGNTAIALFVPIYCSVSKLPARYETCGRKTGFSRDAAWWAFQRLGTLAGKRWGNMRYDIANTWNPFQKGLIDNQKSIEEIALKLYNPQKPAACINYLTKYTNEQADKAVNMAWDLGDLLWTKYNGMW